MKVVFLLIVLFVVACALYGIYAGIAALARIGSRVSGQPNASTEPPEAATPVFTPETPGATPATSATSTTSTTSATSATSAPSQDYVADLQALFALRQSGALTEEEFVAIKSKIIRS